MVPLALVVHLASMVLAQGYATVAEWSIHRFLFHGAGKKKGSPFSFHYIDHHSACRKHGGLDPDYLEPGLRWSPRTREIGGVILLAIVHLPVAWLSLPAYLVLLAHGARYIYLHHRSHVDLEWAKHHLPWHYDHHMAPDQDANWCVTSQWFDRLMGSRVHYLSPDGIDPKRDKVS